MDDLLLIMTMLGSWHKMSFLLKSVSYNNFLSFFFKLSPKSMFNDFRERGKERLRERERERPLSVASRTHPNWGLNSQTFGVQAAVPIN